MEMQQKDVDHQVEINQLNEQLQNQARNFQDEKAMLEREKHEALELAQKTIRDQGIGFSGLDYQIRGQGYKSIDCSNILILSIY